MTAPQIKLLLGLVPEVVITPVAVREGGPRAIFVPSVATNPAPINGAGP